jgi:small subunit ribosomal protein S6
LRTYELALVADPRLSDDDMAALTNETKQLITSRGGEIVREEGWGRRKLAYPINKVTEGRYHFLYLQLEPAKAALLSEVELRLNQNDKVLRFLTVRTDEDLKRASNRSKPGVVPKTGGYYEETPPGAEAIEASEATEAAGAPEMTDNAEGREEES